MECLAPEKANCNQLFDILIRLFDKPFADYLRKLIPEMFSTNLTRCCTLFACSLMRQNMYTNVCSRSSKAYDHDGKTKISIFNTKQDFGLMVTGYSQYGFRMNNDMVVIGPVAVFPRSLLSWNVESMDDINEESLSLFTALEPKLDLLILGIGDQTASPSFSKKIVGFMKKYKINVEVLRTEQACATFNFLNAENRMVATALIPPLHIVYNENDVAGSSIQRLKESF